MQAKETWTLRRATTRRALDFSSLALSVAAERRSSKGSIRVARCPGAPRCRSTGRRSRALRRGPWRRPQPRWPSCQQNASLFRTHLEAVPAPSVPVGSLDIDDTRIAWRVALREVGTGDASVAFNSTGPRGGPRNGLADASPKADLRRSLSGASPSMTFHAKPQRAAGWREQEQRESERTAERLHFVQRLPCQKRAVKVNSWIAMATDLLSTRTEHNSGDCALTAT